MLCWSMCVRHLVGYVDGIAGILTCESHTIAVRFCGTLLILGTISSLGGVAGVITSDTFMARYDRVLQSTYMNVTSVSRMYCCHLCSTSPACQTANYRPSTGQCLLSTTERIRVGVTSDSEVGWSVYSKPNDNWLLVFRGTAGIGPTEPYLSYYLGTDVTTTDVTCQDVLNNACLYHYRNPILDSWDVLDVLKVKFAVYKGGAEVAYIVFNGKKRTILNWFKNNRILESSWTDIKDHASYGEFAIKGAPRNFVINVLTACSVSQSYIQTIWKERTNKCNQDIQPSYPQFLYSTTTSYGNPHLWTDMERADAVAIYIN